MQEKTKKLIMWLCLGIAVIGSIFAIIFAMDIEKFSGLYNVAYGILLAFVFIAIAAILFFLVKSLINGGSRGLLIGLGLLVVVGVISWLLSSGTDVSAVRLEKNGITEATSKLIGAACYIVYVLLAVSALSIVYVEVSKLIKKK